MENFFNNKSIFQLLEKWKKHIIIIVASAIVIGGFISSPIVIAPRFKSSATLYPVNLPELSKESKTEQMLQIIQSMDINRHLFQALNLGNHYKIDSTAEYFSNVYLEFDANVSITKTEYEGVEIVVQDKDPQFACNLIDSLIKFYNEKVESMHKAKSLEMVLIRGGELKKKKAEIDSLDKLQKGFRLRYGIFDIGNQGRELTRGMVSGNRDGNTSKKIDTLIRNINERAGELSEYNNAMWLANQQYNTIKDDYEKHFSELNKKISFAHVVSAPFPADKKSYPIRWLIVLGFAISSLVLSFIGIAIIESRKK